MLVLVPHCPDHSMGLQTRPLSDPALSSSMACLDVETPAVCRVLQRRLQQRRTREQLVEQGIMPPLKCPAVFHEQIRSLQRSRTENFLKHKIRSRPERSELVRMHILQETHAEASLQATQMMLKRARLADDLNEKLAQRPGPMELVVKNILPVEPSLVKDAVTDRTDGGVENDFPKTTTLDVYNFDEDSSDALSPEQPASQESQSSSAPSPSPRTPRETEAPAAPSTSQPTSSITMQHCPPTSQSTTDFLNFSQVSTNEHQNNRLVTTPQPITIVAPLKPGPMLVKQSQPKTPNDKSRSKKNKDAKPRVKKLKYHQYIPPDQKQEPNEAPMDSAYARLLHQQQQFLQLQILSQQQQHYNYQAILPAPLKSMEGQNSCSNVSLSGSSLSSPIMVSLPSAAPARSNQTLTNRKPGVLPANLDEMKVAELKMELKLRGLPVSGTKTDLIERLKPYQESPSSQAATAMELTGHTGAPQPESMSSTPPVSPAPSEVSSLGMEEAGMPGALSPARPTPSGSSPHQGPLEDSPMETRTSEKDQRLHEKERQIEELMWKLEQEQRLVEELKMQLEVEKRGQPSPPAPMALAQVKEEGRAASNCSAPAHSPLAVVKQEEPGTGQVQTSPLPQFFISHQQVPQVFRQPQPQTPLSGQPGTQILLPVSLPTSTATIQLPNNSIKLQVRDPVLQTTVSTTAPGLIQKTEASAPQQQQHTTQTQRMAQTTVPLCTTTTSGSGFQFRAGPGQTEIPQCFLNTSPGSRSPSRASSNQAVPNGPTNKSPSPCQPNFSNHVPKSKDPPRYEEAVKQTRRMQTAAQVPTATSQHMDDLFDVLIESGEISPFIRQDPSFPDKLLPVTASVTTLPFNTVLSRPPPQIQVARPIPTLNPPAPPSLTALATDNQLEAFLEGTLAGETEPRTLRLMEELHSQLLEQSPHSPMDMESDTTGFNNISAPPSSYHLDHTNLDNMEWLELTMPGPTGGLNPLGLPPSGVFSSDFLDSHDLQLHWD
ncbi:myocardin-related transcription factor B-like isoform X2 [Coregonus clupeaformis]|uniref:myocardin-related transcription factor B-like isoform X2 n=1 Tax=Coregonus clupeaformis TaxID=59861 RepID=UPI001BE0738D|nr:myocardin-related transcription factor B-like isoform X2 [Coregonus clupeaformis]